MLNADTIIIYTYSPSTSRKAAQFFLCVFTNDSQTQISCGQSMPDTGIHGDDVNETGGLQLTFDVKPEEEAYTSIDLHFTQDMQINLDKLKQIASFEENWNGYGAEPLSKLVLARSEDVIRRVCIQPDLFPTADNSIQMEYEKSNGAYLEVQITDGEAYEVFFMSDKDSEGEEYLINAQAEYVNEEVKKFYAS